MFHHRTFLYYYCIKDSVFCQYFNYINLLLFLYFKAFSAFHHLYYTPLPPDPLLPVLGYNKSLGNNANQYMHSPKLYSVLPLYRSILSSTFLPFTFTIPRLLFHVCYSSFTISYQLLLPLASAWT